MTSLSEVEHDLHELEEFNFIYKQLLMLTERIENLELELANIYEIEVMETENE